MVALDGVDNATGKTLHRSLKDVSNYKINPKTASQNIKQQAGYSAEISSVAKKNSENIIDKKPTRYARTDDLGRVNDPFADILDLKSGKAIQMKMIGNNPQGCLSGLAKGKYEKYLYSNEVSKIEIPKEYFSDVKSLCEDKIGSLTKQIKTMKAEGKSLEKIEKAQRELHKYEQIKKKISPSEVTKKEAIEARQNPGTYTAKEIGKISHRAGKQGAVVGLAVGSAVSAISNIFAVCKDEKEVKEALKDISFDTAKSGLIGYATASSGAAVSAVMQNSGKAATRALGKSSLPSMIVIVSVEASKSFYRYFHGEIDGVQLAQELGEKGVGLTNSALFAVAAQVAIPIPVVGAMLGGMLGYTLSSMFYRDVVESLQAAKDARAKRIKIEAECKHLISEILNYRKEIENTVEKYFNEHLGFFNESFSELDEALGLNDVNGVIRTANGLTKKVGGKTQFETFAEFKTFMNGEGKFNL